MILLLIEKYIDANDVDISAFLFSVFCFEIKTPQQIKLSSEGLLLAHGLNNIRISDTGDGVRKNQSLRYQLGLTERDIS